MAGHQQFIGLLCLIALCLTFTESRGLFGKWKHHDHPHPHHHHHHSHPRHRGHPLPPPEPEKDLEIADCFNCRNGKCIDRSKICDGQDDCGNGRDESEICTYTGYDIRLYSTNRNQWYGSVEIKVKDDFGYICNSNFDKKAANVICNELGYPQGASGFDLHSFIGVRNELEANSSIKVSNVQCLGNEPSLKYCDFKVLESSVSCSNKDVISVLCKTSGSVCNTDFQCKGSNSCISKDLVCDGKFDCPDGSDEELYCQQNNHRYDFIIHNGQGVVTLNIGEETKPLCATNFGILEAQVMCASYGYTGPSYVRSTQFSDEQLGISDAWHYKVKCNGHESSIEQCRLLHTKDHHCPNQKAMFICSNSNVETSSDSSVLNSNTTAINEAEESTVITPATISGDTSDQGNVESAIPAIDESSNGSGLTNLSDIENNVSNNETLVIDERNETVIHELQHESTSVVYDISGLEVNYSDNNNDVHKASQNPCYPEQTLPEFVVRLDTDNLNTGNSNPIGTLDENVFSGLKGPFDPLDDCGPKNYKGSEIIS